MTAPMVLWLWLAPAVQAHAPLNSDFALKAEVIEALEGGPLVVKATLTYRGREPTEVRGQSGEPSTEVEGFTGWRPRQPPIFQISDICLGVWKLSPGDEKVEIRRLHEDYMGIASGKARVKVKWNVYSPGRTPELIASPSVAVEADIPPATPRRLAMLRKRMEQQILRPNLTYDDRRDLQLDLICTRHHALAPVAWQMIEFPDKQDCTSELIRFVSECPEECPDLDMRLATMAANPDWAGTPATFSFWRGRGTDLSPAAWKTLTEAESVWTRAFTYVTFPRRCGKEWKATLLQDLRDQSQPLPISQFDRLMADLDDDDFAVREKASARLARLGERVEGELGRALDRPLSAEARRRVAAALDRVREAKQPPECARALDSFWAAPEEGELLQVLAEGAPGAWLTQQAKAKLVQWRKARGSPHE